MNPRSNEPRSNPAGLTPLVQMFPMHISEPPPAPARPGAAEAPAGSETPHAAPGRKPSKAG